MYTLPKTITMVVQSCQSKITISSFTAMQNMEMIIQMDLDLSQPLLVREATHFFKPVPTAGRLPEKPPEKLASVFIVHEQHTDNGRAMREKVREAVLNHSRRNRWGKGHTKQSNMFGMVMALLH